MPKNNSFGFTLIELLIVVAILAILALVGFSTYQGAQGNARDARRLSEINTLAKNIESTKNVTDQKYYYSTDQFIKDYQNGLKDPKFNTGYCLKISDERIDKPANWIPSSVPCPSGFTEVTSSMIPPAANIYYMVCAVAERGSSPLCQAQFTTWMPTPTP